MNAPRAVFRAAYSASSGAAFSPGRAGYGKDGARVSVEEPDEPVGDGAADCGAELPTPAVAIAITLFGADSPAALAAVVGVLVEVPVMLSVCIVCNRTRGWYGGRLRVGS